MPEMGMGYNKGGEEMKILDKFISLILMNILFLYLGIVSKIFYSLELRVFSSMGIVLTTAMIIIYYRFWRWP